MPVVRRVKRRAPRFSVVTIVRNEAARLPRLLASLAEFRSRGGEVLVLDTGSDDGTPEIAAAAGCRVVVEPRRFNGRLTKRQARRINQTFCKEGEGPFALSGERLFNFAKARAHAASLATNDFQFAVDGGDVVDAMDMDFLEATARASHPPIFHFETRILNPAGWTVEFRDYLYDRRLAEWRGGSHNFLAPRSPVAGASQRPLRRDQLLVSHHTELVKSRGHQLVGTALEALADPGSPRWRYFLGRALAARGCHRSSLELVLGLDRGEFPPAMRSAGLCLAAHNVAASGGSPDDIEALFFLAARRDSKRRDPQLRLAARRLAEGDMQGAASFATAALAIPARTDFPEREENHSTKPHAILYWALLWLGRLSEARPHFETCLKLDPTNPVYLAHARLFDPGPLGVSRP